VRRAGSPNAVTVVQVATSKLNSSDLLADTGNCGLAILGRLLMTKRGCSLASRRSETIRPP